MFADSKLYCECGAVYELGVAVKQVSTAKTGGIQPTDVQHTQVKMPSWSDVTKDITFSTVGERDVAAEVFSRIARHFGYA